MPGNSRRRGKFSPRSNQGKGRAAPPPVLAQSPVVSQAAEPVAVSKPALPRKNVPVSRAAAAPASYPHVATELRNIAILSAIMLLVLVVLAKVLA